MKSATRHLLLALLTALSCVGLAGRAAAQADAPGRRPAAGNAAPAGEHVQKPTLEMSIEEIFGSLHGHSVPHVVFEPRISPDPKINELVQVYNVNVWQWIALGLMVLVFVPVRRSFAKSGPPSWFARVFRGWCGWIRDEMVYAVMGEEEGRAFAPFFLFLFFFICFMNVAGLVPAIGEILPTATATGSPFVTAPLALITLAMMLFFGMKKNGVLGFFKGLIPHGMPAWLIVIMLPIELVGLVVKPFALTVRLFANMLAGHLVISSVVGLIFVFTKMFGGSVASYLPAIPAVGMATFVFIIEAFVTLLQAYIFTYLSIIFLHQAIHQDH
jgi:F-type H+-transporting ATPase subunit a